MAGGMHGRGMSSRGCVCGRGTSVAGGGCMVVGDMHGREACVSGETATAADGTHPTGMHSCSWIFFACC